VKFLISASWIFYKKAKIFPMHFLKDLNITRKEFYCKNRCHHKFLRTIAHLNYSIQGKRLKQDFYQSKRIVFGLCTSYLQNTVMCCHQLCCHEHGLVDYLCRSLSLKEVHHLLV